MLLPDRLRQAIGTLHTSIEATPTAVAMISGTITLSAYAGWMGQMTHLHTALESALENCTGFETLYDPEIMKRSEVLKQDADALNVDLSDPVSPAIESLVAELTQWSTDSPWKLLGTLYVLEGSRMGSLALARPVARALGVTVQMNCGLNYHIEGAAQRPQTWQLFRAKLAQFPLTEAQAVEVQDAACETMKTLFELYATVQQSHAAMAVPVPA